MGDISAWACGNQEKHSLLSSLYLSLVGFILSEKKKANPHKYTSGFCKKKKSTRILIIERETLLVVPVTGLKCSTTQIDGKLDHVSHCGREHWKDMEVIHSPDIPVVALVTLLFQAKLGCWSLQVRTNDNRNQRWNL